MDQTLYLIVIFPLAGFAVNGLLGRWLTERQSGLIASLAVAGSFLISAQLLLYLLGLPAEQRILTQTLFEWIPVGDLNLQVEYVFDSLTAVMTMVVTGVGLLIHIYSIGYMHGDPGVRRYFSFLNLFTFMMLNLVMAGNLVLLFLGWEGVGLCSYLLIGFWFSDEAKARAGMKAFIINRIGDAGFIIALIMLYNEFGTLNIRELSRLAPAAVVSAGFFTTATMLLFVGATGKSAQIPLFVWLPDAMAGPTPVSALIHAATMVTAGVYLIARNSVLFSLAPFTLNVVAAIGCLTALMAAIIALTQSDIKKVLAYSTISQLGYMFLALGVGAFSAAIFHLMTHAFFKALLFLGAGSIIHGMNGEQDMRKMGGLKSAMPGTYGTMFVAVLAIAGIPGLAGFFSKDEILLGAFTRYPGISWVWIAGVLTAGLTAFYMFRLLFMTFYGKPNWGEDVHPQESPSVMTIPLILLAFLAAVGGYLGIPEVLGGHNAFHHFLEPVLAANPFAMGLHATPPMLEILLMVVSTSAAAVGIYYAYRIYISQPGAADDIAQKIQVLYRLSKNKFYVDEGYAILVLKPLMALSNAAWKWFDEKIVDGVVNGAAHSVARASSYLRLIQTGLIQNYASMVLLGVVFIIIFLYVT